MQLTAAQWAELHAAMAEAHEGVAEAVTFYQRNAAQATDALYGEAKDADTDWVAYATLAGSVKFVSLQEYMTKTGTYAGNDVTVWLPQATILAWEQGPPPRTLALLETMQVEVHGQRFNIQAIIDERWQVADAAGFTRLGLLVKARELPR